MIITLGEHPPPPSDSARRSGRWAPSRRSGQWLLPPWCLFLVKWRGQSKSGEARGLLEGGERQWKLESEERAGGLATGPWPVSLLSYGWESTGPVVWPRRRAVAPRHVSAAVLHGPVCLLHLRTWALLAASPLRIPPLSALALPCPGPSSSLGVAAQVPSVAVLCTLASWTLVSFFCPTRRNSRRDLNKPNGTALWASGGRNTRFH